MTEEFKAGQIVIVSKEATGTYDLIGRIRKIEFDKVLEENFYYVQIGVVESNVCVRGCFLKFYPEEKMPAEEIIQEEKPSNRSTSRIVIEHYVIILLLASLALNIYQYKQINLIERVAVKLLDENEILKDQQNSKLWSNRK
jgi:hypothetical protein